MEEAKEALTPLYQYLRLEVDIDKCVLRGRTSLWLRHFPISHGSVDRYPSEIALHCRQSLVTITKVNGCPAVASNTDSLEEVVPGRFRDAEIFDICYRAKLAACAQNETGELFIRVPTACNKIPSVPSVLPDSAPPAARARWEETVRLIDKSRLMEERREAKRKQGIGVATGSRAALFSPQSPEISMMSPAHTSAFSSPMDSPTVPRVAGEAGGLGATLGIELDSDEDDDLDDQDVGEVKAAANEAHRRLKREENARVLCVEVEWVLEHPRSGVVFKRASGPRGFSASHMYTTYSHAPIDIDGPRCWFPCIDHPSFLIAYHVDVVVSSPKIIAAFNGKLLEKTSIVDEEGLDTTVYGFATETLTAARAVGLAVGRFGEWDVPQSPRVKGMFLRAANGGAGKGCSSASPMPGKIKAEDRRAVDKSTSAAMADLLAHVPLAVSFLEDWLKADYPFKRCTYVFVEGLSELFAPFGSLCLVRAELIVRANDRIPEGDLPGDAKLSVVEVLLYGWVSTALRLAGGKHRWLLHGIAGYLLTQFAAEFRGEEEKQHRLWCAMQKAVALDCDLGCPSMCPPTPDLYIPDAIDPATAYYSRLKASLILHMIEVKLQPTDLQDALGQLMLPITLHVREEDPSLRQQSLSSFSLSRQTSVTSQGPLMRQASVASSIASMNNAGGATGATIDNGGGGTVRLGTENGVDEIGGHFMQPLTAMDFMQLVRTIAAKGGHDLGKDLTENFHNQWVIGQCVPYIRVGYHHKKKANVTNLVVEQVVPPWMGGIACHGPLTIEIWEADSLGGGDGPRRFKKQLPLSRDEKKTPMYCETHAFPVQSKNRRRRRPVSSTPRSSTPVPGSNPNNSNNISAISSVAGEGSGAVEDQTTGPASGPATIPEGEGASGNGASSTASVGLGLGLELGLGLGEDGGVDPERQAMFQAQDANTTPVLWVKVDPNLEWIMSVKMRKPWYQWVEQLFSDESVEAQCDALRGLVEAPSLCDAKYMEMPVQAIAEAVRGRVAHTQMEHPSCVRKEAAVALALWQNQHAPPHAGGFGESKGARVQSWRGLYHLLQAFGERFEHAESATAKPGFGLVLGLGNGGTAKRNSALLLPNWFEDGAEYRLKKALIWAAGNMRSRDGCTPLESVELLVALLKENDNSENTFSDDYYIAQILTTLGQISTAEEAGLPASIIAEAIAQARLWLDLDMLGEPTGQVGTVPTRKTKSHNGVVAASALQCLCQLELLRGGRPEVNYEAYTNYLHPTAVRIAAVQSVIHLYLAYDSGIEEGDEDTAEGLSEALLWVLHFVEAEYFNGETRPRYWAVRCLLDALERRPLVAAHLARFQTDDSLLGECDPWTEVEFHTPLGPGNAAYRPNGPLPKDFPRARGAAERLWSLMNSGTAFDQGLRHLCFQLWRVLWGLETPPCLVGHVNEKREGWKERGLFGDKDSKPSREKRKRSVNTIDGMVEKVKGWVMSRYRRRDSVHRDWVAWYYRDKERQAKTMTGKGKEEEEDEDTTAIPWDGQYGPEPPKESGEGEGNESAKSIGVVQWKEPSVAGAGGAADGEGPPAKKQRVDLRAVIEGGSS